MDRDPLGLIRPPYGPCPNCGQKSVGRVGIYGDRCLRRCRDCGRSTDWELPTLQKKLIYIDQFALSNMMKSLNPQTKAHAARRLDPVWRTTFEKLDRLVKLQLIICPETLQHEEESAASAFFSSLRRLYELLSYGVTFLDHWTVTRFQLEAQARAWLGGSPVESLDRDVVLRGSVHEWTDTIQISVQFPVAAEEIEDARRRRSEGHDALAEVFRRWQTEQHKSFADRFQSEVAGFGQALWGSYLEHLRRQREIVMGLRAFTLEDALPGPPAHAVQGVQRVFAEVGLTPTEALDKAHEFLHSPALRDVPSVRIQALAFAAMAHEAASGRKKPPNRGTFTDTRVVATVLPYCDALLVDNEMRRLLSTGPVRQLLGFGAQLFSSKNLRQFLEFLEEVEHQATTEHLALVELVYGTVRPFTSIFDMEEHHKHE